MDNDLGTAIEDLLEEDKAEINFLMAQLENMSKGELNIHDTILKTRIASFFYKLIEQTPNSLGEIQATSYIIAGFGRSTFGDELDKVVEIAGELELPPHHVSGDVIELFKVMQKLLDKYLSKSTG